ncbi:cytochrome c oxidase subunit II [Nocardioidaceae bacterium]|nr:cytochrome c oxidase subunit II [Nocardioidaceae bacterium]
MVYDLWMWMWAAAAVVGIGVWGLMAYVSVRYRRRSDDEVPVQTRYHLPLEVFYTIVPVVMVVAIFYWTVKYQDAILDDPPPDETVEVVGFQWQWAFNYENPEDPDTFVVDGGAGGGVIPTLWLPVDETVRIDLRSPDVIHGFWVPAFLFKMDIIPGKDNNFTFVPNEEGLYAGKCTELCGTYHSRMLFNVNVVSRAEYDAHLQDLADQGRVTTSTFAEFSETSAGTEGIVGTGNPEEGEQ